MGLYYENNYKSFILSLMTSDGSEFNAHELEKHRIDILVFFMDIGRQVYSQKVLSVFQMHFSLLTLHLLSENSNLVPWINREMPFILHCITGKDPASLTQAMQIIVDAPSTILNQDSTDQTDIQRITDPEQLVEQIFDELDRHIFLTLTHQLLEKENNCELEYDSEQILRMVEILYFKSKKLVAQILNIELPEEEDDGFLGYSIC